MPAPPFDALQSKLQAIVDRQLSYNWTPPALRKSLLGVLDSVAQIGVTMDLASPNGNAFRPAAGQPTDALSLGVGISTSAAASVSAGISLGIGLSATASLGAQLVTGLHAAISSAVTLERDLAEYNVEAQAQAGTNGVMPPGRKVDQGKVNRSLRGLSDRIDESQSMANAAAAARPAAPVEATLTLKRIGEWHCDLDLDQDEIAGGKISFQLDEINFTGTVVPGNTALDGGRARCKVVGGNGRLGRVVKARSYSGSTGVKVDTVAKDILKDCGEDLSDLSDADTLDKKLPRWHLTGESARDALTRLAEACDGAWRVMRDGTVWFGSEMWPEVDPAGIVTDDDGSNGCTVLASETPNMVPGTLYQGRKVEQVIHRYNDRLRTEIRTKSPSTGMAVQFKKRQHEIDYSREYPCKVVTQNTDGTLQLLPDDEIMRARGLDHVPIIYGMPGMKALVKNGARCDLTFAAGDPSRPRVTGWEYDPDKVTLITSVDGTQAVARQGDLVQIGGPGTVVTLIPLPLGVGAPPNNAIVAGAPCLISFSAEPFTVPTAALAVPAYGTIATGAPKVQS